MSADAFAGNWKLHSNSNLEEYMKVMGAPWIARKMAGWTYPACEVTVNGDHYVFKITGTAMTRITEFDVDKEFVESQKDDTQCKSIVTRDGENKLVQRTQFLDFEVVTIREVKDGELVMTMEAKGVTAVRTFHRE